MKKIIITTIVVLTSAAFSNVFAQLAPPGGGDKDLRDTNVKGRSNELERIDREARKEAGKKKDKSVQNQAAVAQPPEDKLAAKYNEIKTDYEQIQLLQDSIIKAYQSSDKIDYAQIGESSSIINKSAVRLNANLFPSSGENAEEKQAEKQTEKQPEKRAEKTDKETKMTKSVRDLIVELDKIIGSFATSAMFQNLRAVDPKISERAKLDLEKIIELSTALGAEARKMAASGK